MRDSLNCDQGVQECPRLPAKYRRASLLSQDGLGFKSEVPLRRAMASAFSGTRDFAACNHLRSYKYYSSSILNPDGFLGYPCASYNKFQEVSHTSGPGKMLVVALLLSILSPRLATEQGCNSISNGRRYWKCRASRSLLPPGTRVSRRGRHRPDYAGPSLDTQLFILENSQ